MALLKVRPRSINMDLPPEDVGPEEWTFGRNIVMRNDATRAVLGAADIWGAPIARPIWAQSVPTLSPKVQYASASGLHATDGTSHTTITPAGGFGGTFQGAFTGGMFNGIAIANDSVRRPCSWNAALATPAVTLPGWVAGDRCRAIRPFKYFLVACGGVSAGVDSPLNVRWSVSAAPGVVPPTWAPLPTNDAGNITLAGAREPLVDMAPVRDTLLIFEPHATWMLSYIGGAYTFGNRRALHTAGLLAPNAWAAIGTEVVFVADGDVLISDGQTVRSVLTRKMQSAMFSALNAQARESVFVSVIAPRQQVIIGFPQGTSLIPNKALIWDFGQDNFGLIDLPDYSFIFGSYALASAQVNWNSDSGEWDQDLTAWDADGFNSANSYLVACQPEAGATGAFQAYSVRESATGGPVEVIARKDKMTLGQTDRLKQVTRIYPKVNGPTGTELFWRVGVCRDPSQPTEWGPEAVFVIGEGDDKVDVRMTGRYVGVQVRSVTERAWTMSGFDIEYQEAGAR